MNEPRIGDSIISANGFEYEAFEWQHGKIKGKQILNPKKIKSFSVQDLECIDHDDGLWQEMQS